MQLKRVLLLAAIIALAASIGIPAASAAVPYEAYTYDYYGDSSPLPAPYVPDAAITGESLGVGDFKEPSDLYVAPDNTTYILDTGNARIIVLDPDMRVNRVIKTFTNNGKKDGFAAPQGLFVSDKNELYVADTDHGRVVVLSGQGELIRIIANPKSDILPADFKFVPLKVTVDAADRVFVIARGVFEGIMQFDDKNTFMGYVGTINVSPSVWDRLWKSLSTKAQKAQMQLFIPTEFSNVDIDRKGFVYATAIDIASDTPIRRLNPSGDDVLKRLGYWAVKGDIRFRMFGNNSGPSKFTDIKVLGGGMYVALDANRARLFTYNDEGNLLYAFGGRGNQLGVFNTPVAVEQIGDKLAVLDSGKKNIVIFRPTKFGTLVQRATTEHYSGNDDAAVQLWSDVLRLNTNYEIAYLGIGKSLLMQKNNVKAMEYFKLGMSRKNYSVAYKRYRREVLKEQFGTFMTVLLTLVVAFIAYRVARQVIRRRAVKREAGLS
ncbi:NHL repeat-containing protein [Paenibacillus sacheonensis]|uniref:Gluconolactonase n=1 Tax=Paenibacillus sacheonensis TaxID=742054 RepID=A0A7X4YL97_9BACL|nr:DNA-binding beta-propeller fold protein YncE [Paenibacillus sacheonensis]NBC68453.1 gluconolactonase [Paenibacillus sacheonensis]